MPESVAIRPYRDQAPRFGHRVYVDPLSALIGDVTIGDDCSFWPGASVRGDVHEIVIGQRSNIQDNAVLHVTHDGPFSPGGRGLYVGDDVTVGHQVTLHACSVGHRCLIGIGAIVLDGAIIEDEVLLAAGSLVSPGKRLLSRHLYRGAPARPVRELTEQEIQRLLYSAGHYVNIKNNYLGISPT
ncbi:MAG: gamma carbonic anhydrase family protein [Gammaproteobacteria bacterium]|nr:gamma carbonic anhydrase family protein [Gammaproteobacteria bacterium]